MSAARPLHGAHTPTGGSQPHNPTRMGVDIS